MYLVVDENLEYVNVQTDALGERRLARRFTNLRSAMDVADFRADNFGETLAVIDADNGDKVMYIAEPR